MRYMLTYASGSRVTSDSFFEKNIFRNVCQHTAVNATFYWIINQYEQNETKTFHSIDLCIESVDLSIGGQCHYMCVSGSDCVSWIQSHYKFVQEREAIHLASLLASHGYIFPIDDHTMVVRNDSNTLYRFQTTSVLYCTVLYCTVQVPDCLLLALPLLGPGEHRLRRLPVQENNAEQGESHSQTKLLSVSVAEW